MLNSIVGLVKKVTEASKEIAQIKEVLKKCDPIMAEVDEQVTLAKERNKANSERLQKLRGTYH